MRIKNNTLCSFGVLVVHRLFCSVTALKGPFASSCFTLRWLSKSFQSNPIQSTTQSFLYVFYSFFNHSFHNFFSFIIIIFTTLTVFNSIKQNTKLINTFLSFTNIFFSLEYNLTIFFLFSFLDLKVYIIYFGISCKCKITHSKKSKKYEYLYIQLWEILYFNIINYIQLFLNFHGVLG